MLKLWNGRGNFLQKWDDKLWIKRQREASRLKCNLQPHAYICAESVADAMRMIEQYVGCMPSGLRGEFSNYLAKCWGNPMKGIVPERGIWIAFDHLHDAVPERIFTPD